MVYFSLFNLFSAYALLALSPDEMRGYRSAVAFLLNPLTMGNAVLQRQDESILTFFFALALLCIMHHKTWRASVIMGLGLLIKITAGLVIIVSFLQEFRWRYLLVPGLVFAIVMAPFLLEAGEKAKFWDLGREHAEHPFQFGGVSLGSLYAKGHDAGQDLVLRVYSTLLVVGVGAVLCVICWRPQGLLEDLALLLTMVLVLSPKSHPGYFSLLTLTLAPLLDRYQIHWRYYAVMALVLVASICKFPLDYYDIGLGIMVLAQGLLVWMTVSVRRESKTLPRRLAWRI